MRPAGAVRAATATGTQEEVYVVLSGDGKVKLDDELRDVRPWDIVRVAPGTFRGFAAGADGLELLAIGSDRPEGGDGVQSDDDWWGEPETEG